MFLKACSSEHRFFGGIYTCYVIRNSLYLISLKMAELYKVWKDLIIIFLRVPNIQHASWNLQEGIEYAACRQSFWINKPLFFPDDSWSCVSAVNTVTSEIWATVKRGKGIYLIQSSPGVPGVSVVKNPPAMQETQVRSLVGENLLEKEMAAHSSILAWEIPWTEEPGRL